MKDPSLKPLALWLAAILGLVGATFFCAAVKLLFSGRFGTGLKFLFILLSLVGLGMLGIALYGTSWGF